MLDSIRSVRLSRAQLAAVAAISALASALIITNALGHSAAQSAAIAALSHHPKIVQETGGAGASDPASTGGGATLPSSFAPADSGGSGSATSSSSSTSSGTSTSSSSTSSTSGTTTGTSTTSGSTTSGKTESKVGHVFVIALSTPSYDAAWGSDSQASYLNHTLKPAGAFLEDYETLTPSELPDYLALISGQAPNSDTAAECTTYSDFPSGVEPNAAGEVPGSGCVYPNTITTLADQVTASGHTWKGYIEDQSPSTCVHANDGALDDTELPGAGIDYDSHHNPFIYFHSLLDLGGCSEDDVSLTKLPHDLRKLSSTPSFSFIAPGICEDGVATSCPWGGAAGIAAEDAFLRQWVPMIRRSAAYKHNGVIVIVFSQTGPTKGPGPQQTGALVVSPLAARHKPILDIFDPYSILRGIEDLLGYKPLAHAKGATSFVSDALPKAG
jgi:phosphatidylinositol-3-phosphatase